MGYEQALESVKIRAQNPEDDVAVIATVVQQLYEMTTKGGSRSAMLEKLGTERLMELVTPAVDPGQSLADALKGICFLADDAAKVPVKAPALEDTPAPKVEVLEVE